MSDTNSKKRVKSSAKIKKENTKIITTEKEKNNKLYNTKVVMLSLVIVITFVFLFLLSNKTFFRTEYKNKNIKIDIPLFMYFYNDENNKLNLKTWRNYNYIKTYFDEYLSKLNRFDFYTCSDGKSFYYDDDTNLVINNITIDKGIFMKTIKINYELKESNKVCD